MAFSPLNNPTTTPALNGKKHRYATRTTFARTLRTDREAEAALVRVRQILSRGTDEPSYSLIVRRSLKWYGEQLAITSGRAVEREQDLVRVASHVPVVRPKRGGTKTKPI